MDDQCLRFWLVDLKLRNNAVAYSHFLAKSLQSGRKRPIWHHFTSAWKQGWKSRRSFSCFMSRLKIKKYTEKRLSDYLYYSSRYFRCWKLRHLDHGGIFHRILNMSHNLLKNTRKRVWKNQPERREAHVRDERWQVKPSFHQSGKCFCKLLPTRKSYFLFWLKK